eukprot:7283615-Prymnesium_polylepis.1
MPHATCHMRTCIYIARGAAAHRTGRRTCRPCARRPRQDIARQSPLRRRRRMGGARQAGGGLAGGGLASGSMAQAGGWRAHQAGVLKAGSLRRLQAVTASSRQARSGGYKRLRPHQGGLAQAVTSGYGLIKAGSPRRLQA